MKDENHAIVNEGENDAEGKDRISTTERLAASHFLSCCGPILFLVGGALVCGWLYALSHYNYLLFHSVIELFTVAVAVSVFMVGWNTRRIVKSDTLFIISVGYISVAILDFFHTLAYSGMGVFPDAGANLPTQLWMSARFVESASLLAAALILTKPRKISETFVLTGYALLTVGLITLILPLNVFPDMYVEGEGLTNIKVAGEYIIIGIVLVTIFLFWRQRDQFYRRNLWFLMAAFTATIAAELAFTLYADVYGVFNFLGHLLKAGSFVCIYKALVSGLLQRPYESLFREVVQSRNTIQERERDLRAAEEKYRTILDTVSSGINLVDPQGIITYTNKRTAEMFGCDVDELVGCPYLELTSVSHSHEAERKMWQLINGDITEVNTDRLYKRRDGTRFWAHLTGRRMLYPDGSFRGLAGNITDITERKEAEDQLRAAHDKLDTLVDLNADGIMVIDYEGTILFMNPAAATMFDRNASELLGQQFGFPLASGGTTEIELMSADNKLVTVELRTRKTEWEEKPAFLTSLRNVTERKAYEEALHRSETKFRTLFESNSDAVMLLDENGFFDCNETTLVLFGCRSREEFCAKTPPDVSPAEQPDGTDSVTLANRRIATAMQEGSCHFEWMHKRNDTGETFPAEVSLTALELEGKTVIQAIVRDISERKQYEEALLRSETKFRTLFNSNSDAVMLLGENGFFDCNDATLRIFGFRDREEFISRTPYDLSPPVQADGSDTQTLQEQYMAELKEKGSCHFEWTHKRVDTGETFPAEVFLTAMELEGEPIIQGVVRDITERKQAEEELKQLQQFSQSTIDALASHIAIIDENAEIIAVNDSWRRFADENELGWSDYGVGRNYLEITAKAEGASAEGAGEVATGIRELLTEETDSFEKEYPCHSPQEERWFRLQGTHFRSPHGLRVVLAHEGITQRKQAEVNLQKALDELQEAQQQLVEQERQRALTTMASGIAHDFNNALSPIQGFSKMLLDKPEMLEDREKTTRYIRHIYKAATGASETIRRMRKFYRPREEDTFVDLDLNSLITDAVSITEPRWKEEAGAKGKNIKIETALGDIAHIAGNEGELNDVITNLIFNAVDAMSGEGHITITTYMQEERVILEFSDNGKGMSEKTKRQCLDPFYTEKGAEGSGLGLATVKGAVQRHNGELSIESTEGEGTTFRMTFPTNKDAGVAEVEGSTEVQEKATNLRLLVVEDEASQRAYLKDLLQENGHEVVCSASGEAALDYLEKSSYDALITDRAMPEMSGDQLAARVKQKNPEMPVIMLTGFGDMMDASNEKVEAVDHVLAKPLNTEKLEEILSKMYDSPKQS